MSAGPERWWPAVLHEAWPDLTEEERFKVRRGEWAHHRLGEWALRPGHKGAVRILTRWHKAELRVVKRWHRRNEMYVPETPAQSFDRWVNRAWFWVREWWPVVYAVALAIVAVCWVVADG